SGLLRRLGSIPHTDWLWLGSEPASGVVSRLDGDGLQLCASAAAVESDELRHGAILQLCTGRGRRLRRCSDYLPPVSPSLVFISLAPPARIDASRSPSSRDGSFAADLRGMGEPHVWPARCISRNGRAIAA